MPWQKPWLKHRITRCFFGPIKRPPLNRDELMDDVDYYPDAYLNRLAHDGVNGLWFTIHFFQTVPSKIIPEYGQNAEPRLEKLRRTVRKCERHGIRIYPFCIEPAAFTWPTVCPGSSRKWKATRSRPGNWTPPFTGTTSPSKDRSTA